MSWIREYAGLACRAAGSVALLAVCSAIVWAQDPSRPVIQLPPEAHSVRAAHPEVSVIASEQPDFPAEITHNSHTATDWGQMARITGRTATPITSVVVGWAYALPAGLEFHKSDVFEQHDSGLAHGGWYEADELPITSRADAPYLVLFVEQTKLKNGMVLNADHAKIAAYYKKCCTGPNAGKIPEEPPQRVQPEMPGGPLPMDWTPTPGLKPINFDVVSFRRTDRPGRGREFPDNGDFISYHSSTIHDLLLFGYEGARPGYFTISGEPDWVTKDFYEFTAKVAPENVAAWKSLTLIDKRYMVQRVLQEALKLKVHDDTSDHPVYDLVVAKGGPKMMEYRAGDTVTDPRGQVLTGHVWNWFDPFRLVCQDVTMSDLVTVLSGPDRSGRVVIDKTGLTGTYDFTVAISSRPLPEQLQQAAEDAGVVTLSVFDGVKQLGLQLVPSTGPIRGIVVDHIERPEAN
jgi:uncharacterized protein (TIGR03435 family)